MKINATFFLGLAVISATAQSTGAAETIVQNGDTLSSIAATQLGNLARWPELCELNKTALQGNCDLLLVGTTLSLPGEATEQAKVEGPAAGAELVAEIDDPDEAEGAATPVAGPVSLDGTWVLGGLTLNAQGTIDSADSLLMAGVYDDEAKAWLVNPTGYTAEDGKFSLEFTTGPNADSVRIYPLRSAASAYAYKTFQTLEPNTSYTATWKIQTTPEYRVSDLVIMKP